MKFDGNVPVGTIPNFTEYCSLYVNMRDGGMTRARSFASLVMMGYDKTVKTLDEQTRRFKATGYALSGTENVRKKAALVALEMETSKEWIAEKNAKNENFDLREFQRTMKRLFHKDLCISTCSNVLRRLGMSRKTCLTRTPGFKKLNPALVHEYRNFILKLKKMNVLGHPSKIRSIDVTYTKKPVTKTTTFSKRGTGKQKSVGRVKLYTDAIVTMISADSMNHTKRFLYTHNPRKKTLEELGFGRSLLRH